MSPPDSLWIRTRAVPPLGPNQVHAWALDLDCPPSPIDWNVLGEQETLRAERFVFPRDRNRYVRAHAAMRALLAEYTDTSAAAILFSTAQYGKPEIDPEQNLRKVRFNLSHSGGLGLFAAACDYQLGVDVEIVRPIERDVAEHHFSPLELRTLESFRSEEWLRAFFRCWTSKEALLKGEGAGLNLPLDSFDVEVDPKRPARFLGFRPPASLAGWSLVELNPADNAVGAVAVRAEMKARRAGDLKVPEVRRFIFNG